HFAYSPRGDKRHSRTLFGPASNLPVWLAEPPNSFPETPAEAENRSQYRLRPQATSLEETRPVPSFLSIRSLHTQTPPVGQVPLIRCRRSTTKRRAWRWNSRHMPVNQMRPPRGPANSQTMQVTSAFQQREQTSGPQVHRNIDLLRSKTHDSKTDRALNQ